MEQEVKIQLENGHVITVRGKKGDPGAKGDTPVKYVDYFTADEIDRFLKSVTPKKEKDYFDGKDGADGLPGKPGKNGRDGLDGTNGRDGKDGKNGSPDTPDQIATKINTLEEVIDPRAIKGFLKELRQIQRSINEKAKSNKMMHGGGMTLKAGAGQTLARNQDGTWTLIPVSGSTGAIIAATNTGDGQNYTLASPLTSAVYYIIMNNASYTPIDTAFPFSASNSSLTFNAPLPGDLANTQIFIICI